VPLNVIGGTIFALVRQVLVELAQGKRINKACGIIRAA
jgi:hypothetical protein